eukprot:4699397-Amphidinium_carterae.1
MGSGCNQVDLVSVLAFMSPRVSLNHISVIEDFCESPGDEVGRPSCPVHRDGVCYDDEDEHQRDAPLLLHDEGRSLQHYSCSSWACWCCQTGGGRRRRRLLICGYQSSTCNCTGLPEDAEWTSNGDEWPSNGDEGTSNGDAGTSNGDEGTSNGEGGIDNCQWRCAVGFELNEAGTGCSECIGLPEDAEWTSNGEGGIDNCHFLSWIQHLLRKVSCDEEIEISDAKGMGNATARCCKRHAGEDSDDTACQVQRKGEYFVSAPHSILRETEGQDFILVVVSYSADGTKHFENVGRYVVGAVMSVVLGDKNGQVYLLGDRHLVNPIGVTFDGLEASGAENSWECASWDPQSKVWSRNNMEDVSRNTDLRRHQTSLECTTVLEQRSFGAVRFIVEPPDSTSSDQGISFVLWCVGILVSLISMPCMLKCTCCRTTCAACRLMTRLQIRGEKKDKKKKAKGSELCKVVGRSDDDVNTGHQPNQAARDADRPDVQDPGNGNAQDPCTASVCCAYSLMPCLLCRQHVIQHVLRCELMVRSNAILGRRRLARRSLSKRHVMMISQSSYYYIARSHSIYGAMLEERDDVYQALSTALQNIEAAGKGLEPATHSSDAAETDALNVDVEQPRANGNWFSAANPFDRNTVPCLAQRYMSLSMDGAP